MKRRILVLGWILPAILFPVSGRSEPNPDGPWLDGTLEIVERTTPAPGLEHLFVRSVARDPENIVEAHVLRADAARYRIRSVLALNETVGRETTSSIARRHGAVAAVNGGFFGFESPYPGEPAMVYAAAGRVLSEPSKSRSALAIYEEGGRQRGYIGHPVLDAEASWRPGISTTIEGINRLREPGEVIWYSPECHRSTLTYPDGVELVVAGGRIVRVRFGGDSPIPASGGVLSFSKDRWESIPERKRPRRGDPIRLRIRLVEDGNPDPWNRAEAVVNGWPQLVSRGVPLTPEECRRREVRESFAIKKHPRTAIGWDENGDWILVVVDGRQKEISMGMGLPTLARWMTELGAVEAMNLDGGGSSVMVIRGEIQNHPSDGKERMVSDAILLFPK